MSEIFSSVKRILMIDMNMRQETKKNQIGNKIRRWQTVNRGQYEDWKYEFETMQIGNIKIRLETKTSLETSLGDWTQQTQIVNIKIGSK